MAKARPRWDQAGAVRRGETADRLLDKHGEALASRIEDPGLSTQLKADLTTLKGSSRGAALGTQKTATASEREIAEDAYDLLMVMREAVKRSPNGTATLRKAIGVGDNLDPGNTRGILDVLAAVAAHADGLRQCRIGADDIAEAASFATQLQDADDGQTSAQQARAGSTEDRMDTQLRIEAAIDVISTVGVLAFRKQPAIRARFERLVSASGPSADGTDEGGGGGGGPDPVA